MDEKVSKGKISEEVAYDDYFLFDNLQAELEKINNFLKIFEYKIRANSTYCRG